MYSAMCVCLDEIGKNSDMVWDGNTVVKLKGCYTKYSLLVLFAGLKVNHHMFGYTNLIIL